jgi:hypothetical protein
MNQKGSFRNMPCPCGSGKKYKKCCLEKEQQKTSDTLLRRLRQTEEQLVPKLLRFADQTIGEDAIFEAWDEFVNYREDFEFEQDSKHNQAFIPWFLYNWDVQVGEEDLDNEEIKSIAALYLEEHDRHISDMERRIITLNCASAFSFYEIIDCEPGIGFTLKDILSGFTLYVTENLGSQNVQPGDILFTKVIQYDNVGLMMGSGSVIITPIYKPHLIDLRTDMRPEEGGIFGIDVLREWDDAIRNTYLEIFNHLHAPPQVHNTDGEALVFHNLFFNIDHPQIAFDALKNLARNIPETELLEFAEYDDLNNLARIEFPWLKAGRKNAIGTERSVLGNISIDNNKLTVFVNSEKRAKKIRKEIENRLGKHATFMSMEVKSVEKAMTEAKTTEDPEPIEKITPEMQEVMDKVLESHWDKWINDKIPALGGLTPRQAVKDHDGREKVRALLADFERREKNVPEQKSQIKYIRKVRQDLGLI